MNKLLLLFFSALLLFSCETKKEKSLSPESFFQGKSIQSVVKYAELFDIYQTNGIRKVVIHSPFSDTIKTVFYLIDSSKYNRYKTFNNVFPFPLTKVGVLSATQMNAISRLDLYKQVAGISDAKYISDTTVKKMLQSGNITEISANGQLFVEKTIMLNLQAIFFSPYQQNQSLPVVGSAKAIPFFDFMEAKPLGKAEWIKFTAVFLGNEKKAAQLFKSIETEYNTLVKLTSNKKEKPTLFSGKYFNGQWFVPGGRSYMAELFKAAGANYIWKSDSSRNSIPLDFEVVLKNAQHAGYWRIIGGLAKNNPYDNLLQENQLYSHFDAFKNHHIIYCDPAKTGYFEKASLEPQVILKDFIFAFHPELLQGYKPVYYKILP